MVWEKRISIYCSLGAMCRFNEAEFAAKFQPVCGSNTLDVRKNMRGDHIEVKMIFHNEDSKMLPLDKEMLVKITSELLNERVEIRIEPGGVGSF